MKARCASGGCTDTTGSPEGSGEFSQPPDSGGTTCGDGTYSPQSDGSDGTSTTPDESKGDGWSGG